MNYTQFVEQIATLAVVPADDTNFVIALPAAIRYAELRMMRDLDFLEFSAVVTAPVTTANRQINIPGSPFVVTEQVNILLPAGSTDPETSERSTLTPVTKEFLDAVYGNSSYRGVPEYYAPFNDNLLLFGPYSDAAYTAEIIGTTHPPTLSASNPNTFISDNLQDLMIMATMVYISGYQRNFGRQSDDPTMAVSYEAQYQTLLKGAGVEESRKKYQAAAWSSEGPSPVATPSR